MSTPFSEQLVTAQRAGLEALIGLTTKAFGSIAELAELNWQVVKSTRTDNQELLTKAFSAKQPQDLLALSAGVAQPALGKAVSYGRQVSEILSKLQVEFSASTAALAQQCQRDTQAVLETFATNMPAGTDAVTSAWKSAISSAIAANETVKKSAKQAVEAEAVSK